MNSAHTAIAALETFATEQHLDASAVKEMAFFLVEKIRENKQLLAIAQGDNEALKASMIEAGVKSYIEQRRQLMTEMLDGSTLRARKIGAQILADLASR